MKGMSELEKLLHDGGKAGKIPAADIPAYQRLYPPGLGGNHLLAFAQHAGLFPGGKGLHSPV